MFQVYCSSFTNLVKPLFWKCVTNRAVNNYFIVMFQVRQWLKKIVKKSVVKVPLHYTSSSPACFIRFYLKTIQVLYYKTVNGVWVKVRTTSAVAFSQLENRKDKYEFYVWRMTAMDILDLKGNFTLNVLQYGEWLLSKRLAKRMGSPKKIYTVIPRLTKIIRSGITFVSWNLR